MHDELHERSIEDLRVNDASYREKCGKFCGILGIVLNALLSLFKIAVGAISGAISILSDGVNNLSDAGSSVITLLGFKLSAKKPDEEHPFGHGRMEYFTGLAVSALIIFVALQLLISSIEKIISVEVVTFENTTVFILSLAVLAVSVAVKLVMALINRRLGDKINSEALKATALDSLTDCVSTCVVLACTIATKFVADFPLDGIAGVLVSFFIAYTGFSSMKTIVGLLIGATPDPELVKEITDFALSFDSEKIIGIHDLIINDYGPTRKLIILHAEVPANGDVMQLHDAVDNLERELQNKFGGLAVIHMDPVDNESERVKELVALTRKIVKEIDTSFDVHDFRMNEGDTHANLIFDLVIPRSGDYSPTELTETITEKLHAIDTKLIPKIKIEYSFV